MGKPVIDTEHNELATFLRTKRLALDPFMFLFGMIGCVLAAVLIENLVAKICVSLLGAVWAIVALGMCCFHGRKAMVSEMDSVKLNDDEVEDLNDPNHLEIKVEAPSHSSRRSSRQSRHGSFQDLDKGPSRSASIHIDRPPSRSASVKSHHSHCSVHSNRDSIREHRQSRGSSRRSRSPRPPSPRASPNLE